MVTLSRKLLIGCGVLVVITIAAIFLGGFFLVRKFNRITNGSYSNPSLAQISTLTSVKFPPGAKLVNSTLYVEFRAQTLWAKVEASKSAADKFVASFPKDYRFLPEDKFLITHQPGPRDATWWTPDSSRKFVLLGKEDTIKQTILYILVDLDDPSVPTIFLYYTSG